MCIIFAGVGLMEFEESTVAASLFDGSEIKSRDGSFSARRAHKFNNCSS